MGHIYLVLHKRAHRHSLCFISLVYRTQNFLVQFYQYFPFCPRSSTSYSQLVILEALQKWADRNPLRKAVCNVRGDSWRPECISFCHWQDLCNDLLASVSSPRDLVAGTCLAVLAVTLVWANGAIHSSRSLRKNTCEWVSKCCDTPSR